MSRSAWLDNQKINYLLSVYLVRSAEACLANTSLVNFLILDVLRIPVDYTRRCFLSSPSQLSTIEPHISKEKSCAVKDPPLTGMYITL